MHSDLLRDGLVRVMQAAFGHEVDAHRVDSDDAAVGAAWLAAGWHAGQRPQQQWVDDVAL
jgi:hypothetical protein